MAPRVRLKWLDVKKFMIAQTQLNAAAVAEVNALDGVTATAAELNILDGATLTVAELNQMDQSAVGAISKVQKFAITAAPDGTEQDTTIVLPAKAIVKRVWIDVTAAEATGGTKTIDVGTKDISNDPNGFIAGASVAATGQVKGTLLNTGQTLGALLCVDEDGAGALVPEDDLTSSGATLTYTAGDTDWVEFRGTIYCEYIEIS